MKIKGLLLILIMMLIMAPVGYAAVVTFDDNPLTLESNWGGTGSGETGFISGDAYFPHNDAGDGSRAQRSAQFRHRTNVVQ
jgi:hypothetical protein